MDEKEENLFIKRDLIRQSLSPLFGVLLVRHVHCDFITLIGKFLNNVWINPKTTIIKALIHPRFGEMIIVFISFFWVVSAYLSYIAFEEKQLAGFENKGDILIVLEEKKEVAASFLMTFILPLLIDDLSTPQNWISYIIILVIVCKVLYQSNMYYQSPVLAMIGYKSFTFKFKKDNCNDSDIDNGETYIGITKNKMIPNNASIVWKYISDDVYLVYEQKTETQNG